MLMTGFISFRRKRDLASAWLTGQAPSAWLPRPRGKYFLDAAFQASFRKINFIPQ
jgi:hypothetical protein